MVPLRVSVLHEVSDHRAKMSLAEQDQFVEALRPEKRFTLHLLSKSGLGATAAPFRGSLLRRLPAHPGHGRARSEDLLVDFLPTAPRPGRSTSISLTASVCQSTFTCSVGRGTSTARTLKSLTSRRRSSFAVAIRGMKRIEQGDRNSPDDSHGRIAKDQDEGDGHKDHQGAIRVATAANEMVFGPLRRLDERDARKALEATRAQLELIDTLLQVPSESHPRHYLVAEGEKARP
jgi:hypothetical protein